MSDSWYRTPEVIPPYEDYEGTLWTWDGVCLNPVHTCEPPRWLHEMWMVDIQAQLAMGFFDALGL